MVEDYTVEIRRRNADLNIVRQEKVPLTVFCDEQRRRLTYLIAEVENTLCDILGKPRGEWDELTTDAFADVRRRLLDAANNIARLPENLCCNGANINTISATEYIANMIAKDAENHTKE
jgi:hypothetical protein